jgi:ribose/xylose/arabinose/galactoside ABC-type transport system permease subunit
MSPAEDAMSERVAGGRAAATLRHLQRGFLGNGILPLVLVGAVVGFGLSAPRFLTYDNLFNVARHASYLMIVCMGQMLTLLVRGIDMSVGSTVALVSVTTAMAGAGVLAGDPTAIGLAIAAAFGAGLLTGATVGLVNGVGVALLHVNPFIMTVGMLSILTGVALTVSGGMPVYGLPKEFGQVFAYAAPLGIPMPMLLAAGLALVMAYLLYMTPLGRRIYALGGSQLAARLAGINTTATMIITYVLCSTIVAFAAVLLTARVATGEATLGATLLLESITAVVIGGVSFFGGIGRLTHVILGALFVTMMTNGMNLLRIESYVQQIVLGALLITAVVVDQLRVRLLRQQRQE